jgi:uncharacterized membrane protein YdbT with pleckstrin-like domain
MDEHRSLKAIFRPTLLALVWPLLVLFFCLGGLAITLTTSKIALLNIIFQVIGIDAYRLANKSSNLIGWVVQIGVGLVAAVALCGFLGHLIRHVTTKLYVFENELIYRKGLIARDRTTTPISEITGLRVIQSIAGRIFSYGTLAIETRGVEQIRFSHMGGAYEAQEIISSLKSNATTKL